MKDSSDLSSASLRPVPPERYREFSRLGEGAMGVVYHGGLLAVNDLSIDVNQGEILGLIGPNGAGKTCILNCVCRFYHPEKGSIFFEETDVSTLAPHKVAQLGIARTFQNIELFQGMTVLDNIKLGAHVHMRAGFLAGGLYWGKARANSTRFCKP